MATNCPKMIVALLFTSMALGESRMDQLTGQIIAYRPADMFFQVASEVKNEEVFLFKSRDPEANVIKLIYEHWGYTQIGADILAKMPMIQVAAHRDKKCDETYGSYIKHSSPIKDEYGKEVLKPVELLMNHDEIRLSAKQRLKCYRVKDDNISVIDKQ